MSISYSIDFGMRVAGKSTILRPTFIEAGLLRIVAQGGCLPNQSDELYHPGNVQATS